MHIPVGFPSKHDARFWDDMEMFYKLRGKFYSYFVWSISKSKWIFKSNAFHDLWEWQFAFPLWSAKKKSQQLASLNQALLHFGPLDAVGAGRTGNGTQPYSTQTLTFALALEI